MNVNKIKGLIRKIPLIENPIIAYKYLHQCKIKYFGRKLVNQIAKISSSDEKIFYFGPPQHKNIGDLTQYWCIKRWLSENYPKRKIYIVPDYIIVKTEYHFVDALKKSINKNDLIFFQSGYNTQDIGGYQDEMHRVICDNFPNANMVFMPQTILFLNEENKKRTSQSHNQCTHALFLARDFISENIAKEMFPALPVYAYPDIVTTLIGQYHFSKNQRTGVLFCVRNDLEKKYSDAELHNLADRLSYSENIDIVFGDTDSQDSFANIHRHLQDCFESLIAHFASYKLIITDRYHGTIFSIIANTPVIVIKSNDHKVVTGVDWFYGVYDNRVYLADDLNHAFILAKQLLHRKELSDPEPYFKQQYYDSLKLLIEREVLHHDNN